MCRGKEFHILVQSYEKHENQIKGCVKVSDWQMNAWTSWASRWRP